MISNRQYIQSTNEGQHWHVYTSKNRAGFVTGNATEGVYKIENGFASFSFMMFQQRQETVVTTAKRATANAETAALRAIIEQLETKGLTVSTQERIAA